MHQARGEGAERRQFFAVDRVDLIGLQPPRHVAEDSGAYARTGEHELPEGFLIEANDTRCRVRDQVKPCPRALEQAHLSEGLARTHGHAPGRLAFLVEFADLHLSVKQDVKGVAE